MKALHITGTWDLAVLPQAKKIVGLKWVFTVKHKADGIIKRYKARLVAKGFIYPNIWYRLPRELYSTSQDELDLILLSLAVNLDWPLHQFDAKNAFLHGDLEEEVYKIVPPGFEGSKTRGKVCHLRKPLYGLKQSPRAWFDRFSKAILVIFKQSQGDHSIILCL